VILCICFCFVSYAQKDSPEELHENRHILLPHAVCRFQSRCPDFLVMKLKYKRQCFVCAQQLYCGRIVWSVSCRFPLPTILF
jgi:hypothetical protein